MKPIPTIKSVLSIALLATPAALAQSTSPDAVSPLNLDPPQSQSLNRFGLSYRMGFNAPVNFSHLGGFPALSAAPYTLDGDRYNYDNGYVLVDSSGNAMGLTRYWGYDNANQVSGNSTIVMQRSSSAPTASSNDHSDTPMSGFEFTYNRELIQKESWRGGLEWAFGYTSMSVDDNGTLSANVTQVSDTYTFPLGQGTVIPPPGYMGRKNMPGPVLESSPTSSATTDIPQGASITGTRHFTADLFSFRLGPGVEIPLGRKLALSLSGGFALVYVEGDFSFNETVSIPGAGSVNNSGSGSHSGWLPGGYVAANLSLALSEKWALVAGAQFEDVGHYTQNLNGEQATLDLSKSIFVTLGLSYSF